MLHGCTVGNRCLIGMGAILMNKCEIGDDSVVAAGALVTENKKFPPRSLIMGSPAKVSRALTDEELGYLKKSAENYVGDSREYMTYVQGPETYGRAGLEDMDAGVDE